MTFAASSGGYLFVVVVLALAVVVELDAAAEAPDAAAENHCDTETCDYLITDQNAAG